MPKILFFKYWFSDITFADTCLYFVYFKLYAVWHDGRINTENNQSPSRKEELKYPLERDKRKGMG